MSRLALFSAVVGVAVVASLLFLPPVWALSQSPACQATSPAPRSVTADGLMCLLVQDPWQDCDEDPWQLTAIIPPADTVSDPWQDDVDPWQPVLAASTPAAPSDPSVDPWQPVMSRLVPPPEVTPALDTSEDPWQPAPIDPWQDGTEDPWQLP